MWLTSRSCLERDPAALTAPSVSISSRSRCLPPCCQCEWTGRSRRWVRDSRTDDNHNTWVVQTVMIFMRALLGVRVRLHAQRWRGRMAVYCRKHKSRDMGGSSHHTRCRTVRRFLGTFEFRDLLLTSIPALDLWFNFVLPFVQLYYLGSNGISNIYPHH